MLRKIDELEITRLLISRRAYWGKSIQTGHNGAHEPWSWDPARDLGGEELRKNLVYSTNKLYCDLLWYIQIHIHSKLKVGEAKVRVVCYLLIAEYPNTVQKKKRTRQFGIPGTIKFFTISLSRPRSIRGKLKRLVRRRSWRLTTWNKKNIDMRFQSQRDGFKFWFQRVQDYDVWRQAMIKVL
jgi:hypothetical protein